MYKVGKYKYKSVGAYQRLLVKVWLIFLACLIFLIILYDQMDVKLFYFTLVVDVAMLLHLAGRYWHSEGWFKYPFNEL